MVSAFLWHTARSLHNRKLLDIFSILVQRPLFRFWDHVKKLKNTIILELNLMKTRIFRTRGTILRTFGGWMVLAKTRNPQRQSGNPEKLKTARNSMKNNSERGHILTRISKLILYFFSISSSILSYERQWYSRVMAAATLQTLVR